MVKVSQMCAGCCESIMSSSWREASTTLSLFHLLREKKKKREYHCIMFLTVWLRCLANLPQATSCSAQFSTTGCCSFSHLHLQQEKNSSRLMSGAGKEICENLILNTFHNRYKSLDSQIKAWTFIGLFLAAFPLDYGGEGGLHVWLVVMTLSVIIIILFHTMFTLLCETMQLHEHLACWSFIWEYVHHTVCSSTIRDLENSKRFTLLWESLIMPRHNSWSTALLRAYRKWLPLSVITCFLFLSAVDEHAHMRAVRVVFG